jgi:hypothetical protein
MISEKYEFTGSDEGTYFEFISNGPKGNIIKAVQFTLINSNEQIYSLGLGDRDPTTNQIDDEVVTDNKDTRKVLATIGEIGRQFLETKPNAKIVFEGNTESKNRLYRMGISSFLDELNSKYSIFGFREQNLTWERFNKKSDYIAFTISKIK